MKNKTTKAGSNPAITAACLLPLDADGFTRILDTLTGETPEQFAGALAGRQIESARRQAWCEITEAAGDQTKHAEVMAQRKLTGLLDDLLPAILRRNESVAAEISQSEFLNYLREDAQPLESEHAKLKARDLRMNSRGEIPSSDLIDDEIRFIKRHLEEGSWKQVSLDFRDAKFEEGLRQLRDRGQYHGELTKEAAEKRIAELKTQQGQLDSKLAEMLSSDEIHRLEEIDAKLAGIRSGIASEQEKAEGLKAQAVAANAELNVRIETARIIGQAIIQAHQIQTTATAA